MKYIYYQVKKYWIFVIIGFTLSLLCIIPIRLAIAYQIAPEPQAILTLGGGADREEFTAKFAQKHPTLNIWVSSGTKPELARSIFEKAAIPENL